MPRQILWMLPVLALALGGCDKRAADADAAAAPAPTGPRLGGELLAAPDAPLNKLENLTQVITRVAGALPGEWYVSHAQRELCEIPGHGRRDALLLVLRPWSAETASANTLQLHLWVIQGPITWRPATASGPASPAVTVGEWQGLVVLAEPVTLPQWPAAQKELAAALASDASKRPALDVRTLTPPRETYQPDQLEVTNTQRMPLKAIVPLVRLKPVEVARGGSLVRLSSAGDWDIFYPERHVHFAPAHTLRRLDGRAVEQAMLSASGNYLAALTVGSTLLPPDRECTIDIWDLTPLPAEPPRLLRSVRVPPCELAGFEGAARFRTRHVLDWMAADALFADAQEYELVPPGWEREPVSAGAKDPLQYFRKRALKAVSAPESSPADFSAIAALGHSGNRGGLEILQRLQAQLQALPERTPRQTDALQNLAKAIAQCRTLLATIEAARSEEAKEKEAHKAWGGSRVPTRGTSRLERSRVND